MWVSTGHSLFPREGLYHLSTETWMGFQSGQWSLSQNSFAHCANHTVILVDLKQIDCQLFLQQKRSEFIQDKQRIAVWVLQPWWATGKSLHGKGRRTLLQRGKESWEGYSKQRVHGFSLVESLPGNQSFFFLLGSAIIQGVRAPPSGFPTQFFWGFCSLIF